MTGPGSPRRWASAIVGRARSWWDGTRGGTLDSADRGAGRRPAPNGSEGLDAPGGAGSAGRASPRSPGVARPAGVPREVLRQVKLIELRTRGWVDSLFGGEYHSVFKGQGMEFAEVREYEPGDDFRTIDWNVTARMGHPYVKKHEEERELTVLLAVDLSGSEQFGTRGRFKAELAAEIAAVLALSAVRNNDRVGLLIFTDRVEHVVPPKKGRRHVLRLIRDVLAFEPVGRGTNIAAALDYAGRMLPHRAILFLLSDFQLEEGEEASLDGGDAELSGPPRNSLLRTLRLVSRRHDLVAIRITDAAEAELPAAGLVVMTDPETGAEVVADTSRAALRDRYRGRVAAQERALRATFRRLAIDEIEVRTGASYVQPIMRFFRTRERRLQR